MKSHSHFPVPLHGVRTPQRAKISPFCLYVYLFAPSLV
uniref:Uncharacterized protein n=1 Tax=Arundo donax TaxID=35708 RepID=A0A0A8ZK87_ARUDO